MYEPNPGQGQPPGQQPPQTPGQNPPQQPPGQFPPQQMPGQPPMPGQTPPQQMPPGGPGQGAYGPPPAGNDINLGAMPPQNPPKKGRRTGLILATVGVVTLALAGGGVYAGVSYFGSGSAGSSTEHLPGSTQAFAEFNLDVSTQQQSKLADVAEKFPELAEAGDPQEFVSKTLSDLEKDEKDLKGGKLSEWVGLGVAAGLWEHDGKPTMVMAVPSTDDAKAEAGLKEVKKSADGELGFVVKDGYATIAGGDDVDGQAAAKAAASEAEKSPLADDKKFAKAAKWMDDDQVLTGWADLEAVKGTIKDNIGGSADPTGMLDGMLEQQDSTMKGQMALGGQAIDGGLEVRTTTLGAGKVYEGSNELVDKLGKQPTGELGISAMIPEDLADGDASGMLGMALGGATGGQEVPPEAQPIVDALAGSTTSASVSGLADGNPQGQGTIETTSPEKAETLAALGQQTGGYVQTKAEGANVTASTQGFQGQGELADHKYFKQAFDGVDGKLNMAAYVDLDAVIPESEDEELQALKAGSFAQGTEGKESVSTIRLFVG